MNIYSDLCLSLSELNAPKTKDFSFDLAIFLSHTAQMNLTSWNLNETAQRANRNFYVLMKFLCVKICHKKSSTDVKTVISFLSIVITEKRKKITPENKTKNITLLFHFSWNDKRNKIPLKFIEIHKCIVAMKCVGSIFFLSSSLFIFIHSKLLCL